MRIRYTLLLFIFAISQTVLARQIAFSNAIQEPLFKGIILKKKKAGRICDTCLLDFIHGSNANYNFVVSGLGRTPQRLSHLRDSINFSSLHTDFPRPQVFIISAADISLTFLPNFLEVGRQRIQLYRNYAQADYRQLEFQVVQNDSLIRSWTSISSLGESNDFVVLGLKEVSAKQSAVPWNQTFFAGGFRLAIGDRLVINIREIHSKRRLESICFFRAVDRATNFVYYQMPLTSDRFSLNLQNILNISSDPLKVYRGDSLNVFDKDYSSIGILRFLGLDGHEQIQYAFEKDPKEWKSVSSVNSENGVFLILGNDLEEGKDQEIYLRYASQPQTVHKITIKVKPKPFELPWVGIAGVSTLLLVATVVGFYLWQIRNRRKLRLLNRQNEDTKARLALLSGQLNPHFLFNSLHAIQGTIRSGDTQRVEAYIGNVAGFMRDVMDNGKKDFISLEEELKIEADYLTLEQERKGFLFAINVVEDLVPSQIEIPPLLFQPVLENSIRHAFSPNHKGQSLSILVTRNQNSLIIKVADNGSIPWNVQQTHYGHGLSLTRKRVEVYNDRLEGMSIRMDISYLHGQGTITIFTFENWLA